MASTEPRVVNKPLPRPENPALTEPFWKATKEHQLVIQRCKKCTNMFFFPREQCPSCLSDQYEWAPVSGRGTVYTFTVVYQPGNPAFNNDVPYVNAVIRLDEGVRIVSNVIGCKPEEVKIGMPVEVVFEDVSPEYTLYKFKPA